MLAAHIKEKEEGSLFLLPAVLALTGKFIPFPALEPTYLKFWHMWKIS